MKPSTKIDLARVIVQHEQQLTDLAPADHPDVLKQAKRYHWHTLQTGADLAIASMTEIRQIYGSFPRPAVNRKE